MLNTFVRLRESAYRLVQNERGVVSFEYVIVAALIVAAVTVVFGGFQAKLQDAFNAITLTAPPAG